MIAEDPEGVEWVVDFKTTKKLPAKESYWEHKMQTAAYGMCRFTVSKHANIYISTVDQGAFVFHDNGQASVPFEAFKSLVNYWRIANNYHP